MKQIIPVVLNGGSGTRLWPMSRNNSPKQFLKLIDDNLSLFQETVLRALKITGAGDPQLVTVTLASMKKETMRQLTALRPDLDNHVLTEPVARNTAAAIAFAACYIRKYFGESAIMVVMPSDHYIGDKAVLAAAINRAAKIVEKDCLIIFGIKPTGPDTGYGYIKASDSQNENGVLQVESFVEKPSLQTAKSYVESGKYLWNSGIHIFEVKTVLDQFYRHDTETLLTVKKAISAGINDKTPAISPYHTIRKQPFDVAILEKSEQVAVIPCDPEWSDIGSWESLWKIGNKDENGNVTKGEVVCHETKNSIIYANERPVICIGLKDLIIVETADAILIAEKGNDEAIKTLAAALQKPDPETTLT